MIEWRHFIDYPSSRSPTGSFVAAVLLCTRFASSFDALREVRKIRRHAWEPRSSQAPDCDAHETSCRCGLSGSGLSLRAENQASSFGSKSSSTTTDTGPSHSGHWKGGFRAK